MNACRSCQAPILWARTLAGRPMPVNPEPDPKGNLVLYPEGGETKAIAFNPAVHGPGVKRFTSHFANCPAAAKFRKGPDTRAPDGRSQARSCPRIDERGSGRAPVPPNGPGANQGHGEPKP